MKRLGTDRRGAEEEDDEEEESLGSASWVAERVRLRAVDVGGADRGRWLVLRDGHGEGAENGV